MLRGSYRRCRYHKDGGDAEDQESSAGEEDDEAHTATQPSSSLVTKQRSGSRLKLAQLPDDVHPSQKVLALTILEPHSSCLAGAKDGKGANGAGVEGVEGVDAEQNPAADLAGSQSAVEEENSKGSLSLKRHRSLTTKQLYLHVQSDYEKEGRGWTSKELRKRILKLDPGAAKVTGRLMKRLRSVHEVTTAQSAILSQGLVQCYWRRGIRVALHYTDAEGLRSQVFDAARKLYMARLKNPKVGDYQRTLPATHRLGRAI